MPWVPELKQCHYWLHGPKNSGKTTRTITAWKAAGCRLFMGPYNNDWAGFMPDWHDMVVFDEFKG